MFESTTIPVLEQVLQFAQARHGVLAGNIANLDTPGYRGKDLPPAEFEARLKQAIASRDEQSQPISFGEAWFAGADPAVSDSLGSVASSIDGILYHDQSNISLEQQVGEISKNQSNHNLALAIMTSQFRLLETAISERIIP